jgi:hypothetical protein
MALQQIKPWLAALFITHYFIHWPIMAPIFCTIHSNTSNWHKHFKGMRSEVYTLMRGLIVVFWDVTPGSLVDCYQIFQGTCYLHLPWDGGSMCPKTLPTTHKTNWCDKQDHNLRSERNFKTFTFLGPAALPKQTSTWLSLPLHKPWKGPFLSPVSHKLRQVLSSGSD